MLAAPLAAQSRDCDGYFTPLVVPAGFCIRLLGDSLGPIHQIVVHPGGQLVIATDSAPGLVRIADGGHAGKAGPAIRFGPGIGGTGVTWRGGWLYFAADSGVVRYRWPANADAPDPTPEWITRTLPVSDAEQAHNARGIAVGPDGSVFVSIGSVSDQCQVKNDARSPGRWPCTELDHRAGIWRFTPPTVPGGAWNEDRYATGIRNVEALAIDPISGPLWAVVHSRDDLGRRWGWADSLAALQPADLLERIVEHADYGWPYCEGFWTRERTRLVRAPEYGTQAAVDCTARTPPVSGFAGHWSPSAATVVNSTLAALPHPGLYITFHGSESGTGEFLGSIPFDSSGVPSGTLRILVHTVGAAGSFRPSGVAVTLDGTVYITDDAHGRLYRMEPHAAPIR